MFAAPGTKEERIGPLFFLCAFALSASCILGGAAGPGFLSDGILQGLCAPILVWALWRVLRAPGKRPVAALAFCVAAVAVLILQIIPLPPEFWTRLPGRQPEISAYQILGAGLPWMPISMAPEATLLGALSLLPPLAVFFTALLLNSRERRLMCLLALGIALISAVLGLMQVGQGPESPLRLYEGTESEAVGFFGNRNHLAALLYALMPFAAAWAAEDPNAASGRGARPSSLIGPVVSICVFVALIAAEVTARSRAGVILTIVAILGSLALTQRSRRVMKFDSLGGQLAAAIVLALVFSTQFALYRMMERFEVDAMADARVTVSENTTRAAMSVTPLGAGGGAFIPLYALFERPGDLVAGAYVNRAHNDLLELWLETGLPGLALLLIFIVWFFRRSTLAWRAGGDQGLDQSFARAASIAIGLLMAHSLVDYPLRTSAIMGVLAFGCALLIGAPPAGPPARKGEARSGRSRRPERAPMPEDVAMS